MKMVRQQRGLILRTLYIYTFFSNGESTEEKGQLQKKKFITVLPVEVASGSDHSQK